MESIWNYQFTKRHICKVPHVASANITFWGLTSTYYHSPTISSDVVNIWGSRCKDTLGAADSHRLWLNESVQVMTIHPWCGKARWIFLLAVAVAGYVCFYDVHGLPSGNETWLAGKSPWKGGVPRKINYTWWIFQQATFDYRKVILNQREYGIINIMPRKKTDACPHIWPLSWYPSLIRERVNAQSCVGPSTLFPFKVLMDMSHGSFLIPLEFGMVINELSWRTSEVSKSIHDL